MPIFLYLLATYGIGSIPTGYIIARLLKKGDIFDPGEPTTKYPGDIFNILGYKTGILVTFLDVLKGWVAVSPFLLLLFWPQGKMAWWIASCGGLLVVIGHCHSIWLGFRGGRGVATSFGVLFAFLPVPALISWFIGGFLSFWGLSTRPGALSAAGAMPILSIPWVWWVQPNEMHYLYIVAFLSLWTLYEHRNSLLDYLGIYWSPPAEIETTNHEDSPQATNGCTHVEQVGDEETKMNSSKSKVEK